MRFRDIKAAVTGGKPTVFDLSTTLASGYTTTFLHAVQQTSDNVVNMVTLEGDITTPASPANGDLVLTLPAAIRPEHDVTFGVFADDGTDYGTLKLKTTGRVEIYGSITGAKKYVVTGSTYIDPYRTN